MSVRLITQSVFDRPSKVQATPQFRVRDSSCMGNRLAEMQLRILWEEILDQFAHIELVGQPEYVNSNFVKGYSSLPVVVHAR